MGLGVPVRAGPLTTVMSTTSLEPAAERRRERSCIIWQSAPVGQQPTPVGSMRLSSGQHEAVHMQLAKRVSPVSQPSYKRPCRDLKSSSVSFPTASPSRPGYWPWWSTVSRRLPPMVRRTESDTAIGAVSCLRITAGTCLSRFASNLNMRVPCNQRPHGRVAV